MNFQRTEIQIQPPNFMLHFALTQRRQVAKGGLLRVTASVTLWVTSKLLQNSLTRRLSSSRLGAFA